MQSLRRIEVVFCLALGTGLLACEETTPVADTRVVDRGPLPDAGRHDLKAPDQRASDGPRRGQCWVTSGGGGTPSCQQESDCTPYKMHCDLATKKCYVCKVNADCAGNPQGSYCGKPGAIVEMCVMCQTDAHCTAGKGTTAHCNLTGTCDGCISDSECVTAGLGKYCATGTTSSRCYSCKTDADCIKGAGNTGLCIVSDGKCEACAVDQDCRDAKLGGACIVSPSGPSKYGVCEPCRLDSDCVKGAANTGLCSSENECDGCLDDQVCLAAYPKAIPPSSCHFP